MRAGFFSTDITPPVGTVRAGNYNRMYTQGVLAPLKVRAAIFEQNGFKVAFAGVDCCTISKEIIDAALDYARKTAGLELDHYIISASHTHSGAAVSPFFDQDLLSKGNPKVFELLKDSSVPDPWYSDWVIKQLGTALIMAEQKLEEAVLNIGSGHDDKLIFNRRFILKDGRTYTHPGRMNPDIVEAAGPIDPEIGVIGAWREDGTLIGCLVNYSCHGTTYSGAMAHGDWYHYCEETLQKIFGKESAVVMLNGACGDITQVNNQSWKKDSGIEASYQLGLRVGAETAKVLACEEKYAYKSLAGHSEKISIARRVPNPESVTEAWKIIEKNADSPSCPDAVFARERVMAAELARLQPQRSIPLTVIQVGAALFYSLPGEFFASSGLYLKENSIFPTCMVIELANDSVGYVPEKAAFDLKTGGGYETVLTSYSNLEINAIDIINEKLLEMSGRMLPPEIIPDDSKDNEPGEVWSYGKLGPEID